MSPFLVPVVYCHLLLVNIRHPLLKYRASFNQISQEWFLDSVTGKKKSNIVTKDQNRSAGLKILLSTLSLQACSIPIPNDILPLQTEIHPWISRSPRITWNETQGVLCTHMGYLWWVPNVTGEKTLMLRLGIKPSQLDSKSYTLPRRYKSWLVPQGRTSVFYTYTQWQ